MSIKRRIAAGIGANAFGQLITIGTQLAALPIYLHFWDTTRYGIWLMLSAIPSYFSMADVGMVSAAGNKMTMELGRGDSRAANRTFQSALVFMVSTCAGILVISLLTLTFVKLSSVDAGVYRLTLGLLISAVLLAFFNGMTEALFRATGRYGLGTTLGQLTRLGEWLGGIIALWWDSTFPSVALGILIGRAIGLGITIWFSLRGKRVIVWGVREASSAEVRGMIRPAAMFMVFPLVNALSFQGFTLLVGGLFGASSVALFNTYRTLARVTAQATTLSFAAGPEMSRLYGADRMMELKRLFHRSNAISVVLAISFPLILATVVPSLLIIWTHGRISYQPHLLWVMLLYAAVSSLWHVPRVLLLSINEHARMAVLSLAMAIVSLGGAWIVGKEFSLIGVVWALVVAESIMVIVVQKMANGVLSGDSKQAFKAARAAFR